MVCLIGTIVQCCKTFILTVHIKLILTGYLTKNSLFHQHFKDIGHLTSVMLSCHCNCIAEYKQFMKMYLQKIKICWTSCLTRKLACHRQLPACNILMRMVLLTGYVVKKRWQMHPLAFGRDDFHSSPYKG